MEQVAKKSPSFAISPVVLKIKLTSTNLLERSHPQNQAPYYHGACEFLLLGPCPMCHPLSRCHRSAHTQWGWWKEGSYVFALMKEKDGMLQIPASRSLLITGKQVGPPRPAFISTDRRSARASLTRGVTYWYTDRQLSLEIVVKHNN